MYYCAFRYFHKPPRPCVLTFFRIFLNFFPTFPNQGTSAWSERRRKGNARKRQRRDWNGRDEFNGRSGASSSGENLKYFFRKRGARFARENAYNKIRSRRRREMRAKSLYRRYNDKTLTFFRRFFISPACASPGFMVQYLRSSPRRR